MIERIAIHASDPAATARFYATVLDLPPGVVAIEPGDAPTCNLHVGFGAGSHAAVDAFWRAGVEAGYRSDGEPGPRPRYRGDYYGAFLLDPDRNSVEAVWHGGMRTDGPIDHVWLRVVDLAAARAPYDALSRLEAVVERDDLVRYRSTSGLRGSLTLVVGDEPTERVVLTLANGAEVAHGG